MIAPSYSSLFLIKHEVKKEDYTVSRYGLIDAKGKIVLEPIFENIHYFFDGYAGIEKEGKYGFCDINGKIVIEPKFKYIGIFSEGLCAVYPEEKKQWVFIDPSGKEVVHKPYFKYCHPFSEGMAAFADDNSRWGYVNKAGKVVIEPQFQDALPFSEGLAPVQVKKLWGYVDLKGNMVIKPQFKRAWGFKKGLAQVVSSGKEEALEAAKEENKFMLREYKKHTSIEEFKGRWGMINTEGKYVVLPQFGYNEGEFDFLSPRKVFYTGEMGSSVILPQYEGAAIFQENLAPVQFPGEHLVGFVNLEGEVVIRPQFIEVELFSEGLAAVRTPGGLWGYIDTQGNLKIPPVFKSAGSFRYGLAPVMVKDNQGKDAYVYIDQAGKTKIEFPFFVAFAKEFVAGFARVVMRKPDDTLLWMYVNPEGEFLWKEGLSRFS